MGAWLGITNGCRWSVTLLRKEGSMEMIDLSRLEPQETLNHTSKGNQLKWKCYGYWYKADHMGYEGLAETIVSALLGKSTVKYPFVAYEYSQIKYKDRVYSGCKSADFLADGYDLIPLEKLYRKFTGGSLAVDTTHQGEITDQIKFLVNFVEQTTGLQEFGRYLTSMLEIDAFFLNEDRHTNNIAVQYNAADNTYALCPLFDNGLSLLADTNMDFPLERSLEDCLKTVEAKPFSKYFDEQLDAAEELYGIQLHFNFSTNDVKVLIDSYRTAYSQEICDRCEALIRRQMRHYGYLVK